MKLCAQFEQAGDKLIGCEVTGHAEYTAQDPAGQILCAAVSSAVQLICNTLTECFDAAVDLCVSPDAGDQNRLGFRLKQPDSVQSKLLQGLLMHFQMLCEDYPDLMTVTVRSTGKQQA